MRGIIDGYRRKCAALLADDVANGSCEARRSTANEGRSVDARVLTTAEQMVALTGEWRELLKRSQIVEPVLTPTWLLSWWEVFGRSGGRRLSVVVIRNEQGRLIALAPLLRRVVFRAFVLPYRRLELIGSGEKSEDEIASNFLGILVERGWEVEVANELAAMLRDGALGGWDELQLTELNANDTLFEPLERALEREGCRLEKIRLGESPYIALPASWNAYLKAIGEKRRYYVRRTLRELDRWAGSDGYQLHVARTQAEVDRGMRILRTLHGERWANTPLKGAFASRRFSDFHQRVTRGVFRSEGGAIEIMWLEVRGRPVSAIYTIVYGNRVYFYQCGRALWVPNRVRPGIAIIILSIQRAIEAGHDQYDLLGKVVRYKMKLACAQRPRVMLRALVPSRRARYLDATRLTARAVAARLNLLRHPPASHCCDPGSRHERLGP